MRVTQRTMYDTMTSQMNGNLSAYMESNMQGGTQKKINRPSDDPAGMARILAYRGSIGDTTQYLRNSDTALGWLQEADKLLTNLSSDVYNRIKTLADQASTDTYTSEQRYAAGQQLRQLMGSILNMSNTRFEGKSIFAGQKYQDSAYVEGLNFTLSKFEGKLPSPAMQVTGKLDRTAMVRFPDMSAPAPPAGYLPIDPAPAPAAGTVPPTATKYTYQPDPAAVPPPAGPTTIEVDSTKYEFSTDGGKTWTTGTIPRGSNSFVAGTATITIPQPKEWDSTNPLTNGTPPNPLKPTYYSQVKNDEGVRDPIAEVNEKNGSLMYIRPTAIYQGANNAPLPDIDSYGSIKGTSTNINGAAPTYSVTDNIPTNGEAMMVRFPTPTPPATLNNPVQAGDSFEYSIDKGKTWVTGTVAAAGTDLVLSTAPATFPGVATPTEITITGPLSAKPYDPNLPYDAANGSTLYFDRTPVYAKDETDPITKVERYGPINLPPVNTSTSGIFTHETLVRFNGDVDMTTNGEFDYSYSTDNGLTWNQGKANVTLDAAGNTSSARLILPGGYMDLSADPITPGDPTTIPPTAPNPVLPKNGQLLLRPQRTDLSFEVMENQYLNVNNVGTSIFGGLYSSNGRDELSAAFGQGNGRNLFETVGKLIGYCETNNREGIGNVLEDLKLSQTNVLTEAASIGGKINRLEVSIEVLDNQKFDQTERVSSLEDVNLTELMIALSKQQMAYNTVLKSSSMIMQLNLTKFL